MNRDLMNRFGVLALLSLPALLGACQSSNQGTIAQLRNQKVEIKGEELDGGLEKAIASYQDFLQQTPESALTPEALRRLADLKVEKEYGYLAGGTGSATSEPAATRVKQTLEKQMPTEKTPTEQAPAEALTAPERAKPVASAPATPVGTPPASAHRSTEDESADEFERRATQSPQLPVTTDGGEVDDLERADAVEAVALYQKLLDKYPMYERNDQVLYQMSRAYEELGRVDEAMEVTGRLVRDYPHSPYIDEVQFRRAEYFFTRRKFLDAEEAYASIVRNGVSSSYYDLALYKLGWTFYKQELYEDTLDQMVALLDYKMAIGYDFAQTDDDIERKRMEDTFRVTSLSFSNLGGADSAVDYFSRKGNRSYEDSIYSNLAEFYFDKRRYSDAAGAYDAFVSRNPFHRESPQFNMRIIEIHQAGGFPSLILEAKKDFATRYGLKADYWDYFDPNDRPEVLADLKTNLTDLANHYHAKYQKPRKPEDKGANFEQALHWYGEFLTSFPAEVESPGINYQLADLLLENKDFGPAAVEYEKTAYSYPAHEQSSKAGYAAVYAYRQQLGAAAPEVKDPIRREVVRCSLRFADAYPEHDKAAIVLAAAADDLYGMKDYAPAVDAGRKLIANFPGADSEVVRSAWLVVGHSTYELERYSEAETAYVQVLALLPEEDKTRETLYDNLAASIYKQGEQAKTGGDFRAAADHFLRVGQMAPTSKIRVTAEYDGAAALIQLKDWEQASTVLLAFRNRFPGHELQPEVTKKIAYAYRESGKLALAAAEFERIETETDDEELRREALLTAAELYEEAGNQLRALDVYRRYVGYFPKPVELALDLRQKIATILKAENDQKAYLDELRTIVAIEADAGSEQTPRTRYLAATAALILTEPKFDQFVAVQLVEPFKTNLRKKRKRMKAATKAFNKLLDYQVGEVTAASTYYLAEIYGHFSKALMESERPTGLSALELEQYELALEEQAYPFEEKAIEVHENTLKLITVGVYNSWVDKSLQKLAVLVPARYDKAEITTGIIESLELYTFEIQQPEPKAPQVAQTPVATAGDAPVPSDSSPATAPATDVKE